MQGCGAERHVGRGRPPPLRSATGTPPPLRLTRRIRIRGRPGRRKRGSHAGLGAQRGQRVGVMESSLGQRSPVACEAHGRGATSVWRRVLPDVRRCSGSGFVPSTQSMHSTQVGSLVTSNRDQGPCSSPAAAAVASPPRPVPATFRFGPFHDSEDLEGAPRRWHGNGATGPGL